MSARTPDERLENRLAYAGREKQRAQTDGDLVQAVYWQAYQDALRWSEKELLEATDD